MIKSIYNNDTELKLKSSAATPILYRQMYKKDLIKTVMSLKNLQKDTKEETAKALEFGDGFEFLDFIKELAFIMNIEATTQGTEIFKVLTFENYVNFLTSYDEQIFTANAGDILGVWSGSQTGTSNSKNA